MRTLIEFIGTALFDWWLWVPLLGALGYGFWQNQRKTKWVEQTDHQLLLLQIPRDNDKKELAAEQLFASLHGILRSKSELVKQGIIQEHISFEFASIGKLIRFYVWVPKHLRDFVEGQIYAQYPGVNITEIDSDYAERPVEQPIVHTVELTLNAPDVLPIKTFPSFEVDPLAAITATLSKLEGDNEEMWIQILTRPVDDSWHRRGSAAISRLKSGRSLGGGGQSGRIFGYFTQALGALVKPPEPSSGPELNERERAQITAIETKSTKLGYDVKVRIAYLGSNQEIARQRVQAIVGTFKQFNSTNLNGFEGTKFSFDPDALKEYRARYFPGTGFAFNIEELASLWHLPHTTVETPNIVWATTKTSEPPATLPTLENTPNLEISLFGATNFRARATQFGLKRSDRDRHLYIVGQTGTGKSGLLRLLTLSDIYAGHGFAVIDPHGDYALDVLRYVPQNRLHDVVYFNPADTAFPIAFNPLEVIDPSLKNHISSEIVGVLKRMFESWGPRLEYILRYTLLALLDYPESTMLDITRMLTDKHFRDDVISHLQDPVVATFWIQEFASWNEKFATEAVAPVLNKVGAFTANPMVRNIIGQPTSSFNIRTIMDEGKILVVNLSRGLVGEDNAAVLGALMVTKIQLAAMSRADMAEKDRRPFYLYVDEFQNFATDSFAVILSEARKYGLNLSVANQYIAQMSLPVRDAVFGNVGGMVMFRVGADDANFLAKYVSPQFEAQDLMNMATRHFVAALSIGGEKTAPFSGTTLMIPPADQDFSSVIIDQSRQLYAKPREMVAEKIGARIKEHLASMSRAPTNQQPGQQRPPRTNTNHQSGGQHHAPARQHAPNQPRPQQQPNQHKSPARTPQPQPKAPAPAPQPVPAVHPGGELTEQATIHLR
jgi:hypothetical protein